MKKPFDPEKKARLLDMGKWGDFLMIRQRYRDEGMTSTAADKKAYAELVGDDGAVVSEGASVATSSPAVCSGRAASEKVKCTDSKMSGKGAFRISGAAGAGGEVSDNGAFDVCDGDFAGKRCARSVAIEWAYVHSGMRGVKPEDAPSALAWCLMMDFRKSAAYKFNLFSSVAAKAVAKEDLEVKDCADLIDGQEEYDILARLAGGDGK